MAAARSKPIPNPELPNAVPQNPACGSCSGETRWEDSGFYCEDCGLYFRADDMSASFLDPNAQPCGAPCDNYWHGDNKIKTGRRFDCYPCQLPVGHSSLHWTGCQPNEVADAAREQAHA
jgi:hypothetical protein